MALAARVLTFNTPAAPNAAVDVAIPTGGNWPAGTTPKLVLFLATGQATVGNAAHGIGMLGAASATQQLALAQASDDVVAATNAGQSFRTNACLVLLSNGTPTVQTVASLVSFGSDTMRLNFTTASVAQTVVCLVLGGADLTNVAMGTGLIPNNNAVTQNITAPGFTPDAVIAGVPHQPASPTEAVHTHWGLGFATRLPATAQGHAAMAEIDGSTAITTVRMFRDGYLLGGAQTADTAATWGRLTAWTATGFDVIWDDGVSITTALWFWVAIKGGTWQYVVETEATTNTGKVTSLSGFSGLTPRAAILESAGLTADTTTGWTTTSGDTLLALGVTDGTNEAAVANIQFDGAGTSANSLAKRRLSTDKALSLIKTPTTAAPHATVSGEVDVTFQAGQLTGTWTGTDGTARRFMALVVGDAPAAGGAVLAGTAAGAATGSAARLTLDHALAGSAAGSATGATTRLSLNHALAASDAGAATATATRLTLAHPLAATDAVAATGAATTLVQTQPLAGTAAGAASGTATRLTLDHALTATDAGAATGSATRLTLNHPLMASAAGQATAGADLTLPGGAAALAATGVGTSTGAAVRLTLAHPLAAGGTASAAGGALGLMLEHALAALGTGAATAAGDALMLAHPLAAIGPATAGATANLAPFVAANLPGLVTLTEIPLGGVVVTDIGRGGAVVGDMRAA